MKNRVGLGTFPLAGVFTPIDKKSAASIIKSFIDNGGYYIDTAPMYGFGEIETLLGETLKSYPRDTYYMITKCGFIDVEGKTFGTLQKSSKYNDVIRECEKSLKRLQTDYIDLYMVHSPDKNTPFDETMRALHKLRDEGKIKQIAVSNVNLEELKQYNKDKTISYVENRFSMISRSLEGSLDTYMKDNNIKLIPYHLLEIGLLTGIAFENYKLLKGDMRENLKYWDEKNQKVIFEWVRTKLAPIAKEVGSTIGQLNIAWALSRDFIDFVIVGTTREDYLKINLKANEIKLTDEVLNKIEKAYSDLINEVNTKFGQDMRTFRGLNEKFY